MSGQPSGHALSRRARQPNSRRLTSRWRSRDSAGDPCHCSGGSARARAAACSCGHFAARPEREVKPVWAVSPGAMPRISATAASRKAPRPRLSRSAGPCCSAAGAERAGSAAAGEGAGGAWLKSAKPSSSSVASHDSSNGAGSSSSFTTAKSPKSESSRTTEVSGMEVGASIIEIEIVPINICIGWKRQMSRCFLRHSLRLQTGLSESADEQKVASVKTVAIHSRPERNRRLRKRIQAAGTSSDKQMAFLLHRARLLQPGILTSCGDALLSAPCLVDTATAAAQRRGFAAGPAPPPPAEEPQQPAPPGSGPEPDAEPKQLHGMESHPLLKAHLEQLQHLRGRSHVLEQSMADPLPPWQRWAATVFGSWMVSACLASDSTRVKRLAIPIAAPPEPFAAAAAAAACA